LSAAVLIVVSQGVRERWRGDIHDACPVHRAIVATRECRAAGWLNFRRGELKVSGQRPPAPAAF